MNCCKVDDSKTLISQICPGIYNETASQQGKESKRRRRSSKKTKGVNDTDGVWKKRKLSEEQAKLLEMSFEEDHKLESERKHKLASELGLDPRQVAVWFQNRRARWKNKKLEEECGKLRDSHDSLLIDKFRLESQVLELKELLAESEREIQKLTERIHEVSSHHSPASSLSVEATTGTTPFQGDFGVSDDLANLFYSSENSDMINHIEWMGFYM